MLYVVPYKKPDKHRFPRDYCSKYNISPYNNSIEGNKAKLLYNVQQ